jgi:hypothetical protein
MNRSRNYRQLPLALFPGQPTAALYDRAAELLRPQHRRFLATPTGKGFMQVSLNKGWAQLLNL